ncbi:YceI family protein [Streptacidiphilus sp. N1-3]|uniref:YceI family protein n=1 Tax=Streptacidiphilus alkalitolerans TaxID=3342712 RepID=A0ABV6X779_9ACTN
MSTTPTTAAIPDYLVGTWKADPVHSEVAYSVRQLMVSKARGRFADFDVTIVTGEDPLDSSVAATIDIGSIDTGNATRDKHLCSEEYFDVAKHPTMSYRSTGIRWTDGSWVVDGELTLHGVTRQVPLTLEVNGFVADPFGGQRAGFSATAQVNRHDFGVDGGGVAVSDKVAISLEIQAVLQT